MDPYQFISRHYEKLFPAPSAQALLHIRSLLTPKSKGIDLGCGTGSFLRGLAKHKIQFFGLDSSWEQIQTGRQLMLDENLKPSLYQGDMIHSWKKPKTGFDLMVCLGNTLPHLGSLHQVSFFLHRVAQALKPKGQIVFQFLNFIKIKELGKKSLPSLEAEGGIFKRTYVWNDKEKKPQFHWSWETKNAKHSGYIEMIPLFPDDFIMLAKQQNLNLIQHWANWNQESFTSNSDAGIYFFAPP